MWASWTRFPVAAEARKVDSKCRKWLGPSPSITNEGDSLNRPRLSRDVSRVLGGTNTFGCVTTRRNSYTQGHGIAHGSPFSASDVIRFTAGIWYSVSCLAA